MASFLSRLAVIAVLALTACGPVPSATSATTTPSTSPATGSASRLFVIIEGKTRCYGSPCTVAIVDRDGHVQTRRTFNQPPPVIVGWDRIGPVAVPDSHMAYIGFIEGTVWGGPAVHLDLRGQPVGGTIGGASCAALFGETNDGKVVCHDRKAPTVRDSAGTTLWSLKPLAPPDDFSYGVITLSPDASHVAFSLSRQFAFDSSVIRSREGV